MFTGIIEGFGTVKSITPAGEGKRLMITSEFSLDGSKSGDSIAVNVVCLTVERLNQRVFEVDVAPESVIKTVIGGLQAGNRVNLERALRFSDRLDGHLVSGHVDGMGSIVDKKQLSNAVIVRVNLPQSLADYTVLKGSIAIDGISLTINERDQNTITLSVIPHTAKLTTIGFKNIGETVNIETDMIGKYVAQFVFNQIKVLQPGQKELTDSKPSIANLLAKQGFLN